MKTLVSSHLSAPAGTESSRVCETSAFCCHRKSSTNIYSSVGGWVCVCVCVCVCMCVCVLGLEGIMGMRYSMRFAK